MLSEPEKTSDPSPDGLQIERRRHPRVSTDDQVHISLPVVVNAEVLDISSAGALISTPTPLETGQRAHLRVLLGREPFSAWVEVCRVIPGTIVGREERYHLGVTFTSVDDTSRRTLQRFVRTEPHP